MFDLQNWEHNDCVVVLGLVNLSKSKILLFQTTIHLQFPLFFSPLFYIGFVISFLKVMHRNPVSISLTWILILASIFYYLMSDATQKKKTHWVDLDAQFQLLHPSCTIDPHLIDSFPTLPLLSAKSNRSWSWTLVPLLTDSVQWK